MSQTQDARDALQLQPQGADVQGLINLMRDQYRYYQGQSASWHNEKNLPRERAYAAMAAAVADLLMQIYLMTDPAAAPEWARRTERMRALALGVRNRRLDRLGARMP